MLDRY